MTHPSTASRTVKSAATEFEKLVKLFGGRPGLKRSIHNLMDAHELMLLGIPGKALEAFVHRLVIANSGEAFEKAFGMSERTFLRHKSERFWTLNAEQTSRTWNFARILTKATDVFGSQKEAEKWMIQPVMGLDNQRPIDLLVTAVGIGLVVEFLERLAYGVYP